MLQNCEQDREGRQRKRERKAMAAGTRGAVMAGRTTIFTAMAVVSIPFCSGCRPPFSSGGIIPRPRRRYLTCRRRPAISTTRWRTSPGGAAPVRISAAPSASSLAASSAADIAGGAAVADTAADVDLLDLRVGRVLKAWKHSEADSLYVEEVELAEPDGPRIICSGLVNYVSLEELQGRGVIVFANLKARNMRGVKSNGMLLAASNADHTVVQLLTPPEGSVTGERVWFGNESGQASQSPVGTPNQVQKKKIWENIQPHLKTSKECVATLQSKPMRTSKGLVTCQSLQDANIS